MLIVQNAVGYEDLGVATSGATFFRSIGASFGVAIFGTIFASQPRRQARRRAGAVSGSRPGFDPTPARPTRRAIAGLPPDLRGRVLHAYASVDHRRLPVRGAGRRRSASCWPGSCKEDPLRGSVTAPDVTETLASNPVSAPRTTRSPARCPLLGTREGRREIYEKITARAGLRPAARRELAAAADQPLPPGRPVELGGRTTVPTPAIERAAVEAESRGYAVRDGIPLVLTPSGAALAERLIDAEVLRAGRPARRLGPRAARRTGGTGAEAEYGAVRG